MTTRYKPLPRTSDRTELLDLYLPAIRRRDFPDDVWLLNFMARCGEDELNLYSESADQLDRDLVFEFFWRFSVFECALKREGFLRAGRGNAAEASWDNFAEEQSVVEQFESVIGEAAKVLIEHAPRCQVVRDGRLAWEKVLRRDNESRARFVFGLVQTVRNNLFHGGNTPSPMAQSTRWRVTGAYFKQR